jgi:hypothetical protein
MPEEASTKTEKSVKKIAKVAKKKDLAEEVADDIPF